MSSEVQKLASVLLNQKCPLTWQSKWEGPEDPLQYHRDLVSHDLAIQRERTSCQDGGVGKQVLPLLTTTAKITTTLQNQFHQDLLENRAVWKFNNEGFKEVTFIHMGRRGSDVEAQRQLNGWSHIQV